MITLNILVFDDKLTPALKAIQLGLELFVGKRLKMPNFDTGEIGGLDVDAMFDLPAMHLRFSANRECDSSKQIVEEIENGTFDTYSWDAVIIDNNWGNKETDDGGSRHILPACLQRPHFQMANPHYIIFTWHFKENPYLQKVMQALTAYQNVVPIGKDDHPAVAEWFRQMLRARVRRQLSREQPSESATRHALPARHLVVVQRDGTLTVNGEVVALAPRQQTCLLFLFYLGSLKIPVRQTKDVIGANQWLCAAMSGNSAEQSKFNLELSVVSALQKIRSFDQTLKFPDEIGKALAAKAWDEFGKKFQLLEVPKKGGAGNAPEVILKSVTIQAFDLQLTRLHRK